MAAAEKKQKQMRSFVIISKLVQSFNVSLKVNEEIVFKSSKTFARTCSVFLKTTVACFD